MNFIPAFYEQIMARISDTMPEIKHVDLFFDQYSAELIDDKGELPFLRPAIFIELNPTDVQTLGNNRQAIITQVKFHLVTDVIQEVDSSTSQNIRNKGHAHKDLIDKIQKNFQGWNGAVPESGFKDFGTFNRESFEPYMPLLMMMIDKVTFRSRVIDNVVVPKYVNPNAADVINIEIL